MTLPDDWTTHALGELFEFSNGINADKSAYGQGTAFVNVLDVITSESLTVDAIPGRIALSKSIFVRYRVNHGDVLFNRTSETQDEVGLSSTYLGDEPVVFGGFVFRAQPKTAHLNVGYSKYCLRGDDVRSQITARGQGGIRANIGQRDLKSVVVALPNVPEQRVIGEVLGDASALVNCLQALIEKKRDVKQGIMQELLMGRTRLPGFTGGWTETVLRDVLKFQPGFPFLSSFFTNSPSGRRLVRNRDLRSDDSKVYYEGSFPPQYLLSAGDLLIGMDGEFEPVIWRQDGALLNQRVGRLLLSKHVDGTFLAYALQAPLNEIQNGTGATTVKHLSHSDVESISMLLPSDSEQSAIAEVLQNADAEITALERRLESARAVKVGMMQELLTGRTLLPVTEELSVTEEA